MIQNNLVMWGWHSFSNTFHFIKIWNPQMCAQKQDILFFAGWFWEKCLIICFTVTLFSMQSRTKNTILIWLRVTGIFLCTNQKEYSVIWTLSITQIETFPSQTNGMAWCSQFNLIIQIQVCPLSAWLLSFNASSARYKYLKNNTCSFGRSRSWLGELNHSSSAWNSLSLYVCVVMETRLLRDPN